MMKLRRTLCFVVAISIVFGCVGMVAAEDVPQVAACLLYTSDVYKRQTLQCAVSI